MPYGIYIWKGRFGLLSFPSKTHRDQGGGNYSDPGGRWSRLRPVWWQRRLGEGGECGCILKGGPRGIAAGWMRGARRKLQGWLAAMVSLLCEMGGVGMLRKVSQGRGQGAVLRR